MIYQLVKTGSYYFLSRPRRFGKSLLVSTLEAYFEGLAIGALETGWGKHPVLHMDLNTSKYDVPESLDQVLNDTLVQWEKQYGSAPSETTLELRFKGGYSSCA